MTTDFLAAARPHLDAIPPAEWGIAAAMILVPLILFVFLFRTFARFPARTFYPSVLWLLFSGAIHSAIELTFTLDRDGIISKATDFYGAADFRYGRPLDPGTAAMEYMTAILVGPFCFLTALAAVNGWRWRHPLQIVTCTSQLYGLVWFSLQPTFTGGLHSQASSDPFLFWFVFFGLNAPWGVFPTILLVQSFYSITSSLPTESARIEKKKKR
ncbi:hypothetical protein PROFUN_09466 [Planoprotostelium fungivorum]|uniref:EXPERA domain-containing protein n=1 Tax=Planoprotostelium fungivorum TaxID=1890364 RepID=A0A2P6NH35_9EUKA|nr:hypothetical protein PROFUN_10138 [Planoprotostelium fungivorum]PRP83254.1 hypothetical protein PROFUN_09466 [Planoprotostelium fungivorum]